MEKCKKCGARMGIAERRYLRREETYRRYVCKRCGSELFTAEFEIEDTKDFRKSWAEATLTPPRREE